MIGYIHEFTALRENAFSDGFALLQLAWVEMWQMKRERVPPEGNFFAGGAEDYNSIYTDVVLPENIDGLES